MPKTRHHGRLLPWVLILAAVFVYRNSLTAAFLFDDLLKIVDNSAVHHPAESWAAIATGPRPATTVSLAANFALARWFSGDGLDVRGYHVVNLLIHALAGLALFGLVRRTIEIGPFSATAKQSATRVAFAVALLWLVHPLQTEAVTYTIQRSEGLMGLCYLLTLYALARGATSLRHRRSWHAVGVTACAVGMGSKEVMVTAPVCALLYDRIFLAGSWREVMRRRWRLHVGLAATWAVLGGSFRFILGRGAGSSGAGFRLDRVTPWDYALSQPGVLAHYLRLAFWPSPLCLDYDWPPARTWTAIVPPAMLVAILLTAAAWALWRRPALGFVGVSFFLILAPTSSIMPIADRAAEHRMYLPLATVVLLVVTAVHGVLWRVGIERLPADRMGRLVLRSVLLMAPAVALGTATVQRNQDYRDDLTMWADVAAKRPRNDRAYHNLGQALAARGEWDAAIQADRRALAINPYYPDALTGLGAALRATGEMDEAIRCYLRALELNPASALTHNNLGAAYLKQGNLAGAVHEFTGALRLDPHLAPAQNNLGEALERQGRLVQAVNWYRQAVAGAPGVIRYRCDLAEALWDLGQKTEALAEFQKVSARFPGWPRDAARTAWTLATDPRAGHRDGTRAVRYARQACLATGERDPVLMNVLAAAYAEAGCFDDALAVGGRALCQAQTAGQSDLATAIQGQLARYRARQPLHPADRLAAPGSTQLPEGGTARTGRRRE